MTPRASANRVKLVTRNLLYQTPLSLREGYQHGRFGRRPMDGRLLCVAHDRRRLIRGPRPCLNSAKLPRAIAVGRRRLAPAMGLCLTRSSTCESKVKVAPKARSSADAVPSQSPLLTRPTSGLGRAAEQLGKEESKREVKPADG
jgi:hypothetical protein